MTFPAATCNGGALLSTQFDSASLNDYLDISWGNNGRLKRSYVKIKNIICFNV